MVLIPFAYKSNGQTLVDIDDVPSGKACDCICPSCHCPLIARHCTEDREDHFAHDPAFKLHQDYIECDFSIHVAIRLMLKQLLAASHTLKLPNYIVQEPSSAENITVTKGKNLDFDRISIEVRGFDAVIDIAGYQLAIFISYYPGRMVAPRPNGNIKGIIQLDITEARGLTNWYQGCLIDIWNIAAVSTLVDLQESLALFALTAFSQNKTPAVQH